MRFPLIYAGCFLTASIVTAITMPLWRRFSARFGLIDDPGDRKIHGTPVPLGGGIGVFVGILGGVNVAGALLVAHFLPSATDEQIRYGFSVRAGQLAVVLGGALAMLVLGLIDDRWELRPALKFLGQFLVATTVALSGIRITMFVPSLVFSYLITILWILTVVNAFNFMDNMNGLCGGLAAIASFLFGFSAAYRGEYLVAALAFLCCGAFCGFLPYNFPRATIFLGDSGSHLAGFLVAVLGILPHYYSPKYPHALAVTAPLLILAVPLFDLAVVVLIRWRAGRPFYIGDTNHLSHRLVRRGLTRTTAVLLIWAVGLLVGSLSLLL